MVGLAPTAANALDKEVNMTQGGGLNHMGQDGAWTNFEMSCCGTSAGYFKDGEATCGCERGVGQSRGEWAVW